MRVLCDLSSRQVQTSAGNVGGPQCPRDCEDAQVKVDGLALKTMFSLLNKTSQMKPPVDEINGME